GAETTRSPPRTGGTQRSGFARPFFSAASRSSDTQEACQGDTAPLARFLLSSPARSGGIQRSRFARPCFFRLRRSASEGGLDCCQKVRTAIKPTFQRRKAVLWGRAN